MMMITTISNTTRFCFECVISNRWDYWCSVVGTQQCDSK